MRNRKRDRYKQIVGSEPKILVRKRAGRRGRGVSIAVKKKPREKEKMHEIKKIRERKRFGTTEQTFLRWAGLW